MTQDIKKINENAQAGNRELAKLKEVYPHCFDSEGRFNKEKFLSALPGGLELTDETSGFNWLGKNYGRMLYNMESTTVICPDEEHNSLPENRDSKNVYISGDNLDALQHLVKSYSPKIQQDAQDARNSTKMLKANLLVLVLSSVLFIVVKAREN